MLTYAMSFLGVPYVWGGNSRDGFDCSGFVQEVLMAVGLDPRGDQTAQRLYDALCEREWRSQLGEGSILFFGNHRQAIHHVAIALNDKVMIEAGGGNSKTRTIIDAKKLNACVRIRPIRKDLIAVLKPKF